MGAMVRLAVVATSVGLADSVDPGTIGPALYLATAPKPARRLTEFTAGAFAVNFVAGLILTTGPGGWLLGLVPRPHGSTKHAIELAAGVVLLGCAAALWLGRERLLRRDLPMPTGGSAFISGVSIAAIGLPTAIPYLAVIAAIVASSATIPQEVVLIALYNVAFVLPLLAIVIVLLAAGRRAERPLKAIGVWVKRQWPIVLAVLLLLIGSVLVLLGGAGLVKD
jgi:cytochrome c biogenesis protein CcdA